MFQTFIKNIRFLKHVRYFNDHKLPSVKHIENPKKSNIYGIISELKEDRITFLKEKDLEKNNNEKDLEKKYSDRED
tara:strand:- start:289 stop:516 length:228 start_codon:yes stop_codon:yes gene_type:complete